MLFAEQRIGSHVLWYYTPMALPFTRHLKPLAVVYDCMDELSAFAGAPPALRQREAELMKRADLVLTGGQSLYEAKRAPASAGLPVPEQRGRRALRARAAAAADPADQAAHPASAHRLLRRDRRAVRYRAVRGSRGARPDWHFVLLGPVVKIDPRTLPQGPNLHYLGSKQYQELPPI